jgi:protein-tyrosine-phosphatase/predicted ATP-grasp superfamily ATP-dependent carboligase
VTGGITVLIFLADAPSSPEVAWSLADAGFRVVAIARHGTRPAVCKSRFVQASYISDPAVSVTRALFDLKQIARQQKEAILLPLDDHALFLAQRLQDEMATRVCGAIGRQATVALDKRQQLAAAAGAGFWIPETLELEQIEDLHRLHDFPCVLKPALAARVVGDSLGRGRSSLMADREELAALQSGPRWNEPMLAQPFLSGVGEGIFGLALGDRVVAWSGHRRVRMMNPSGSGSSACISRAPSADIRAVAERFLMSLEWRGLFMIEMLRDAEEKLWFMELNGRPWGSLALSRRMGYEYPAWAVQRLLDREYVPPEPEPRPPLLCRHLGREIAHLAFVARGPRSRALVEWPTLTRSIRDLLVTGPDQRFYNWRKDDQSVFMFDTWETIRAYLLPRRRRGKATRSWRARALQRFQSPVERWKQSRIRAVGGAATAAAKAQRILFLCYGNINRSALAERHLAHLVGNEVAISSCGFHAPGSRPADSNMVAVASEHGVSLENWSSRTIDGDIVAQADIILSMEAKHLVRLYAEYPEAKGRAFLLSCVTPKGTVALEIQDPFGKSRSDYEWCVKEVIQATSRLAVLIRQERMP